MNFICHLEKNELMKIHINYFTLLEAMIKKLSSSENTVLKKKMTK